MNEELKTTYNGNIKQLVQQYGPDLMDGIAGGLTHGIIHLGWAIDANCSDWMICEGLAYLNFCYLGVDPSKFVAAVHDDATLLDALIRVSDTFHQNNLQQTWVESAKKAHDNETFHPELVPSGFQWELSKVIHDAHPVATEMLKFLYRENNSNSLDDDDGLFRQLYKDVVILYLATVDQQGRGSFLILHALTSLWGLEKTLAMIDDPQVTFRGLRQYYASLICLLATASTGGFPKSDDLQRTRDQYHDNRLDDATLDWTEIVNAAIGETEEHNIKLVYVAQSLWKRYHYWSGFSQAARTFTVTPDIGPDKPSFLAS